jgi:uncharacterized protein involved in type VI secretion and phage assembly
MPGYDGAYRGVVLNTTDPEAANRVQVQVPDVSAADSVWATAEQPQASLPSVGGEVTVRFENGDETRPIWAPGVPSGHDQSGGHGGYNATYRATVINNVDSDGHRRVAVQVPDLSTEAMWAMPEQQDAALPAIGDEVSIRFQDGNVEHPLWSGGSGTGAAPALDGVHRGTVINNMDPAGLGRLCVQVPGVSDGVWASPEQAPPGVGEEVAVRFEGGSAEHAVWSH